MPGSQAVLLNKVNTETNSSVLHVTTITTISWKEDVMAGALVATLEHEDEGVQNRPPQGM